MSLDLWVKGELGDEQRDPNASSLFVVSQRGPFAFTIDGSGRLERQAAGGGLASAIGALARRKPVTWFAAAMGEGDRVAARRQDGWPLGRSHVHLVDVPRSVQALHYGAFCNPLLWLVQHEMAEDRIYPHSPSEVQSAWDLGYWPANKLLAERVVSAFDAPQPIVLVQDYHLYLVPTLVRRARPDALIGHFVHIPWPAPEAWSALPRGIVRDLLEGLLGANLIGVQTAGDAERFLATCRVYGVDASRTWVRHYPITVDPQDLKLLAEGTKARGYAAQLADSGRLQTIVRIDRLDPAKNVAAGFEAFGRLLARDPSLRGGVRFLAHLVPSRSTLAEYQLVAQQAFAAAQAVNHRFGTSDWQPIQIFYEENRARAVALLSDYDVLLVNSRADGMNLVAKEGAVLNRRDGVLVLTRRAGAWDELGPWAIGVEPMDVDGTAGALGEALTMAPEERSLRAVGLREAVERSSLSRWFSDQLTDLRLAYGSGEWMSPMWNASGPSFLHAIAV